VHCSLTYRLLTWVSTHGRYLAGRTLCVLSIEPGAAESRGCAPKPTVPPPKPVVPRVNWEPKGDNTSILRKSHAGRSHALKDSDPRNGGRSRYITGEPVAKTPEQIGHATWRQHLEGSPIRKIATVTHTGFHRTVDVITARGDGRPCSSVVSRPRKVTPSIVQFSCSISSPRLSHMIRLSKDGNPLFDVIRCRAQSPVWIREIPAQGPTGNVSSRAKFRLDPRVRDSGHVCGARPPFPNLTRNLFPVRRFSGIQASVVG
jgi:hypothetical protein